MAMQAARAQQILQGRMSGLVVQLGGLAVCSCRLQGTLTREVTRALRTLLLPVLSILELQTEQLHCHVTWNQR